MSGYTRQSVADIVPTAVVRAAPINAEYNKLRDAFTQSDTGTTGHKHDGTSDEGSYVPLIADLDAKNKIQVVQASNRFGVWIEVGGTSTEQVRFQDGAIIPVTDNDIDLGTSSLEFKNVYVDGTAFIDTVSIGDTDNTVITDNAYTVSGNLTFDVTGDINLDADGGDVVLKDDGTTYATLTSNSGNLTLKSGTTTAVTFTGANADIAGTLDVTGATVLDSSLLVKGNTTLGNATSDTVTYTARAVTDFLPNADATYNLGNSSLEWNNLWLDGTANVDTLQVDENATVTGGMSVGGNMSTTGNNVIGGNLSVNGNTSLGDTAADTVTFNADVASNIIPSADSTHSLGDSSNYWSNAYIDSITTTGAVTIGTTLSVGTTLDMTSGQINNVATPTLSSDAATKGYVDTEVSNLVAAAPGALDTLNELAAAIGDDANFSTTVTNSIATKLPLAGGTMTGNIAMGGSTVTGLATPSASSDAVTKGYVDTVVGDLSSAAASAAAAEAAYDSFDDRYLGSKSSSPTLDNDGDALITGALYFDTTANQMKVYNGSSWQDAGSTVNGTSERQVYTATASQTTFAATYDVGFVDVYLNGVKLKVTTDFTATNGTSIVLTTGATAGDVVDIVAYGSFNVADTYTQAQSDARFVHVSGDTMTGDLDFGDNVKATFGASGDLEIYHDGSQSIIRDSGTGQLAIRGENTIAFTNSSGSETYTRMLKDGAVSLYHNNSQKISTTSTGVDITGKITCDDELFVESSTDYGRIEIGGPSGAFIDLKSPFSDDYDGRLIADGASLDLTTSSDIPVRLKHNDAEKMRTTSTGVDITGELIADSYNETYAALSGTSPAVNCEAGNSFSLILSGNTTFTFTNPPASGTSYTFSIEIIQDSGGSGYSVTWPTSVDWPAATAPTLTATASAKDVFVFTTRDGGTTWYGFTAGQALA